MAARGAGDGPNTKSRLNAGALLFAAKEVQWRGALGPYRFIIKGYPTGCFPGPRPQGRFWSSLNMPIYEYVCDPCSHHLEALQKISEEPLIYCPECGEATLRKKVSAAAFRLKGTGWYETDFKDSGKEKKKEAGKDKSDRSAGQTSGKETGASSGDTTSDSKTETSSDSKTGNGKSETKPATDSGGSDSTGGSSKPSSGASPGSD